MCDPALRKSSSCLFSALSLSTASASATALGHTVSHTVAQSRTISSAAVADSLCRSCLGMPLHALFVSSNAVCSPAQMVAVASHPDSDSASMVAAADAAATAALELDRRLLEQLHEQHTHTHGNRQRMSC